MDASRKGRQIEWIEGNAGDITTRGSEIYDLGQQMIGSAGLLKAIADGATGMEGLSIKKVQDVVGDVYEELHLAGERYYPTGSALKAYGNSLADVQTNLHTIVNSCESLWQAYMSAAGDYTDVNHPLPPDPCPPPQPTPPVQGPTAAESKHAQDIHDALVARNQAHEAFLSESDLFDAKWDTWDEAFELAASRIGKATTRGISDDWTDNLAGWVEGALKVLAIVGLVLAVLAIVIGGPLIAALAAVVAIATLVGTIYLKWKGRASWSDVAWAVVGVLPFGKLAKFAEGGKAGLVAVSKGFVAAEEFGQVAGKVKTTFSAARVGWTGATGLSRLTGGAEALWTTGKSVSQVKMGGMDILARYMGVDDAAELAQFGSRNLTVVNYVASKVVAGHIGEVEIKGVTANSVSMGQLVNGDDSSAVDSWADQLAKNP